MKTPKPRHLPSGNWNIILRLGGETISVTEQTRQLAVDKARMIKAEYLSGKREQHQPEASRTLHQGIEAYMADRSNGLSPSTLAKYLNIDKNHWQTIRDLKMDKITRQQWQRAVNEMLEHYAPKTVQVSLGMVKTVLSYHGVTMQKIQIGRKSETRAKELDSVRFLEPDQILRFVDAVEPTPYAVPLLLALSSLRIAEIDALSWEDVHDGVISIRSVRVKDKSGNWVVKPGAKNETSVRDVPILIPALQRTIDRDRAAGKLMTCSQEGLRKAGRRICQQADLPWPGVHGLRHSFASLTAHLQIPLQISQKIGGWANDKVMLEIYTHIVTSDLENSLNKIRSFYSKCT